MRLFGGQAGLGFKSCITQISSKIWFYGGSFLCKFAEKLHLRPILDHQTYKGPWYHRGTIPPLSSKNSKIRQIVWLALCSGACTQNFTPLARKLWEEIAGDRHTDGRHFFSPPSLYARMWQNLHYNEKLPFHSVALLPRGDNARIKS